MGNASSFLSAGAFHLSSSAKLESNLSKLELRETPGGTEFKLLPPPTKEEIKTEKIS